jgi:type VI secretion system protein ImpL
MDNVVLILIVLLILLVVSVAVFIILVRRSQQRVERAAGDAPAPKTDTVATDVRAAVAALRDRVPGGKFQDRVPWILLLGEAGSGKTTLLDQMASGSAGMPSPREGVQWRFLDAGALIDVPGSFLTDPSGKGQTDGRWQRLLRLLLRHRPARPVDGVVLTIPAAQLLPCGQTEAALLSAIAAALRSKLDDLQKLLGMVVPVYILVTKCDQIRGFASFCWQVNPDLDDDIFGWSNPNTLESAFSADWIDLAFDSLLDGILRQQMRIFGSCPPSVSSDEMFVFPMEIDRTRNALRDYLSQIFRETSYLDSNFLRGIYFCGDAAVALDRMPARVAGAASLLPGTLSGWGGMPVGSGLSLSTALAPAPIYPLRPRLCEPQAGRQIVFARHLFDFKVFQESKAGRPIARARFTRHRTVPVHSLPGAGLRTCESTGFRRCSTRWPIRCQRRATPRRKCPRSRQLTIWSIRWQPSMGPDSSRYFCLHRGTIRSVAGLPTL